MPDVITVLLLLMTLVAIAAWVAIACSVMLARSALKRVRLSRVTRTLLAGKASVLPGVRGDIGRLRVRVTTHIRHTQRVVLGQPSRARSAGRDALADMAAALEAHAALLDQHLALAEREPDPGLQRQRLGVLTARAEELIADATALRSAAYALADGLHDGVAAPATLDLRDRINGLGIALRELRP